MGETPSDFLLRLQQQASPAVQFAKEFIPLYVELYYILDKHVDERHYEGKLLELKQMLYRERRKQLWHLKTLMR